MATILDIAPSPSSTVRVRGTDLEIRGVDNRCLVGLFKRFPSMQRRVVEGQPSDDALLQQFEFMPAAIAAGLGHYGDAEVEEAVMQRLTIGEQTAVFTAVMGLTMPDASGPLSGAAGDSA